MTGRDLTSKNVQLQLVWSPDTIKSFGIACAVLALFLAMMMCSQVDKPQPINLVRPEPVTLLVFGEGDGTGARKGNLTAEGARMKGQDVSNPLDDASRAATTATGANPARDPTQTSNVVAAKDVGVKGPEKNDADAAERTIGSRSGSDDGYGLGDRGSGRGAGLGLGDVDWGGGGNRTVLKKTMPEYPPGSLNTTVKLRFRVLPDGSVSAVWPVKRAGNPDVDRAAIRALQQWRFNKLDTDTEMEGTITFVFRTS
jgi:TonB family protein